MAWAVSAQVDEFDEASAYFSGLVPMTQGELDAVDDATRARAFTIAARIELQAVQTIFDGIAESIASGTPYEEFAKGIEGKLGKLAPDGALLETVFVNNVQQSYNVGRWEQMTDPVLLVLRPYILYDSVLDSRTSTHCLEWDGVVRGHDDPCWLSHSPQCHHRCFPAGTMVSTARGQVPIELVVEGDAVLTHRGRYRRVTALMQSPSPDRLVKLTLHSGRTITGTASHPALTERGWIELAALREGDCLLRVGHAATEYGSVGNAERDHTGLDEKPGALKRESTNVLRDLDTEVCLGQVEVNEDGLVVNHDRLLKYKQDVAALQPADESGFGLAGRNGLALTPGSSTDGVLQEHSMLRRSGLASSFRGAEPPALDELPGHGSKAGMVVLRASLGPVETSGHARIGQNLHNGAALGAPGRGVPFPLGEDSLAAVTDPDAILSQQSTELTHLGHSQGTSKLPEAHPLDLVHVFEDFAESVAVFLEQPILGGCLEIVSGHELIDATSASVFNLGVADDESYVADGLVVHNCRATIRSLRESEAKARGITLMLPQSEAATGFGAKPTLDASGLPPPNRDTIDDDVWTEFENRLALSNVELDQEQLRIADQRYQRDNDNE